LYIETLVTPSILCGKYLLEGMVTTSNKRKLLAVVGGVEFYKFENIEKRSLTYQNANIMIFFTTNIMSLVT
jgi:hypothetical protein